MRVSRVLYTIAIAAFATAALANGLDRLSGNAPGLERVVPIPFRAQADRSAAATAIDRKDAAGALANSRNAVAVDPIDPDSTAALGSALTLAGRNDDAARTFRIAARFGWRNVQTQAFWYDAALQTHEYEVAADRADALLRVHPRLVDEAELLQPMESDPAASKVLAQRLQMQPPWLGAYLGIDDDTPSDVIDRRLAVLSAIDSAHHPMGCDAVRPFAKALLDNGRRHDAETLWNANCSSMKVSGYVADPTFSQVLDKQAKNPFSWRIVTSGDLSISQEVANGGRNLLLTNSAPGTRLALLQTVAFQPGKYHFRAQGPEGQSNAGKIYISWACNDRPPFPQTSAGDLLTTGEDIYVSQCDRQQIGLWLPGGGASVRLRSIEFQKIG